MNYNSPTFWILFALVMLPYWRLGLRAQNRLLLVASYFFYGFWDYRFLFLILISTVIDYIGGLGVAGVRLTRSELRRVGALLVAGALLLTTQVHYAELGQALLAGAWGQAMAAVPLHWGAYKIVLGTLLACLAYGYALPWLYGLPEARRRKWFLAISMVANLAILGFFKYFDFFATSLASLIVALGWGQPSWVTLNLILPAGISFYTFQAMSYTIDIYRKEAEPTRDLGDFALFVCFFPHLVAGPIMRAHTLLPQVVLPRQWRSGAFEEGLFLVLMGLFKKVVVADNMAPIVNAVFNRFQAGEAAQVTGPEVAVAVVAFAFQIYGDFSGYSSVARGISKWLGFELAINFRNPYVALNPSDFWQRWHISLSSWLRDYLYIPLGGSRGGQWGTYRNMMITMLLGGLWHGANWTFIAWGFFHGSIQVVYRALGLTGTSSDKAGGLLSRAVQIGAMFVLTCIGWLLFRADSMGSAWQMTARMFTSFAVTGFAVSSLVVAIFYCLPMFAFEAAYDAEHGIARFHHGTRWVKVGVYSYLLVMLTIFASGRSYEFIYFQF